MRHLFLILLFTTPAFAKARVVMLGDSLTEGYGLSKDAAYPALLEKKLKQKGKDVEIINAGISGSTSASGLSRLRWQLKTKTHVLVLALGANDGLRGLDPKKTEKNLTDIITLAKQNGIKVLLAGMKVPPNYGPNYTQSFEAIFPAVAKAQNIPLLPFLLEGVAANPKLNLPDGIHPNPAGHQIIAETLLKPVLELL